jgi:hypothetical protein
MLCAPDEGPVEDRLVRPQFDGLGRMEWPGEEGVDFHLGHGEWLALLRENGFEVEALHELRAPEGAQDHSYYEFVPAAWARKWPAEDLWHARKRA